MITIDEIMIDEMYDEVQTDIHNEMFKLMSEFEDEHQIIPPHFLELVDRWLNEFKNKP
tara:strand:+ start:93 stop:266 length:174 start_codon:yes stop_codon:yes gene_type:complete